MKRTFGAVFFVFFFVACNAGFVPEPSFDAPASLDPGESSVRTAAQDLEARVFELVNAERRGAGLAPLERSAGLDAVARAHSEDMRDSDYFAHVSPEGETLPERLLQAGFPFSPCAENIGMSGGLITDYAGTVVRRWMASEGHRVNILDATGRGYAETGVGVAYDEDVRLYYFTQVFRSL